MSSNGEEEFLTTAKTGYGCSRLLQRWRKELVKILNFDKDSDDLGPMVVTLSLLVQRQRLAS